MMTAKVLAQRANVTYRQVEYWTNQGYLVPLTIDGLSNKGTGHVRIYDDLEMQVALVLGVLTRTNDAAVVARSLVFNRETRIGHLSVEVVES